MHFKFPLIDKLSDATPRKSILKWFAMTFIYSTIIIVNDHFDVIQALGLPERLTTIIRLVGVYLYIMLTTHSFYKTQNKNENSHYDNQIPPYLENDDKPDGIPATSGTQIHAQRDRHNEPQSNVAGTGTT